MAGVKAVKDLTRLAVPCCPWSELVTEIDKRVFTAFPTLAAVAVLAVYYLRLFLVQRELALGETLHNHFLHTLRFLPRPQVTDGVVGIPLEGYFGVVRLHPLVEHAVQEQVGQHWPNY